MRSLVFASAVVSSLALASLASAQPGGRGGPGGGGVGGLLQNEQVTEELGLTETQVEDLQDLLSAQRDKMREMFQGGGFDFRDPDSREKIREMFTEQAAKLEQELGTVLKPEQLSRLKQINRQMQTRRPGSSVADNEQLMEELGVTEAQMTQMKEMAPKLQEEIREKIQAAQKEAEEKLLSVLTPSQKAKYAELMGEPFQLDPTQGGFGGPGGRGGFGQGGAPGGRGPGGPGGRGGDDELPEL